MSINRKGVKGYLIYFTLNYEGCVMKSLVSE